jgi:hypothetical protein
MKQLEKVVILFVPLMAKPVFPLVLILVIATTGTNIKETKVQTGIALMLVLLVQPLWSMQGMTTTVTLAKLTSHTAVANKRFIK